MAKKTSEDPQPAKPHRNIIWVDSERPEPPTTEDGKPVKAAHDPWVEPKPFRTAVIPPAGVIEFPDEETQRAGFYLEHAGLVIRHFDNYEEFREDKGA